MSDDVERRKEEIRRRLRLSRYPRKSRAVFSDENGHNPWVLEDCPNCGGRGHKCEERENGTMYLMVECSGCEGLGTTTQVVRFFPEDGPETVELEAVVDEHGWITCPRCERRFSTRYTHHSWTGRRHLSCGQFVRLATR
jgi:hypothetical protein